MNWFSLVTAAVPILIQFFTRKYRQEDLEAIQAEERLNLIFGRPENENTTYDFIVVGAGSAGCVVAARLAVAGFSVLHLEAGGDPTPASDVVLFWQLVTEDGETNYKWLGQPQRDGPLAGKGRQSFSGGKMLGGSGSHNGCVHNRGSPRDYDNWANLTGDQTWSYASILQHFKRMEDLVNVGTLHDKGTEDEYGRGGPLTFDTDSPPILPVWFEAGKELGYRAGDANGPQHEGFHAMQKLMRGGRRVSSYTGYVRGLEASHATRLKVLRYSDVQRILFDEPRARRDQNQDKLPKPKAKGVFFLRHGRPRFAFASREVIVSAGAIRSPLLLQKSGVGPRTVLQQAGIRPIFIRDGVGANLGDHEALRLGPFILNTSAATPFLPRIRPGEPPDLVRFVRLGKGPLAGLHTGPQAFFVSQQARREGHADWPDISITIDTLSPGLEPQDPESVVLNVVNARSRTRGSVLLDADAWRRGERDDTRLTRIDFQLMSHSEDVDVFSEGIRLGLRIMENTTAFQGLGAVYAGTRNPNCLRAGCEFRSDAYWRCVVRHEVGNWVHLGGTNAMGRPDDSHAVLDSKLRVIGVAGLRVIDASAMPALPNGNPNASTLMLAEKGVEEILEEHGRRPRQASRTKNLNSNTGSPGLPCSGEGNADGGSEGGWSASTPGTLLISIYLALIHLFLLRLFIASWTRPPKRGLARGRRKL